VVSASGRATSLYERFEAPVFRYCLRRLRNREEAEDALQNTYLRAFTALRRGVVPDLEAPWLFKIAHNVCLSQRLAVSRRARVEAVRDTAALEQTAPAPARTRDELITLDDVLAEMPVRMRTAFLLREWQGLSYLEIAGRLGTSHAAVETLIFRARRHLARALEGEAGDRPRSPANAGREPRSSGRTVMASTQEAQA
jgi:RNA polymerase sigma-70 factor (ECF subfamily)